jgi:hypothetical protein
MQSQIQIASTVKVPVRRRKMGSSGSGGWKKYCVVDEHKYIVTLFL